MSDLSMFTAFDAALERIAPTAPTAPVLSDGAADLLYSIITYGDKRVADQRNDDDSALTVLEHIERELQRNEQVRDQMRTALLCAANVLSLLAPEVARLGCRAGNVAGVIRAALDAEES